MSKHIKYAFCDCFINVHIHSGHVDGVGEKSIEELKTVVNYPCSGHCTKFRNKTTELCRMPEDSGTKREFQNLKRNLDEENVKASTRN